MTQMTTPSSMTIFLVINKTNIFEYRHNFKIKYKVAGSYHNLSQMHNSFASIPALLDRVIGEEVHE